MCVVRQEDIGNPRHEYAAVETLIDRGLVLHVVEPKDLMLGQLFIVGDHGSKKGSDYEVLRFKQYTVNAANKKILPQFEHPSNPSGANTLQEHERAYHVPHPLDCSLVVVNKRRVVRMLDGPDITDERKHPHTKCLAHITFQHMSNTKHYSVRWRWACPDDLADYDQDKWPALPEWALGPGSHPTEDRSGFSKAHWDNLPPDVKISLQDSAKKRRRASTVARDRRVKARRNEEESEVDLEGAAAPAPPDRGEDEKQMLEEASRDPGAPVRWMLHKVTTSYRVFGVWYKKVGPLVENLPRLSSKELKVCVSLLPPLATPTYLTHMLHNR